MRRSTISATRSTSTWSLNNSQQKHKNLQHGLSISAKSPQITSNAYATSRSRRLTQRGPQRIHGKILTLLQSKYPNLDAGYSGTAAEHACCAHVTTAPNATLTEHGCCHITAVDLGLRDSLHATATEHGCRQIPSVNCYRQVPLAPLLQSMAGN